MGATNTFKVPALDDVSGIWEYAVRQGIPLAEESDQLSSYASSLWKLYECPRRCYWDRVEPLTEGNDWFMTAKHGDYLHGLVVEMFKRAGMWRGDEIRGGVAKFNLSYRIDLLIEDAPLELCPVHPVEIKTINNRKWEQIMSGHEWGDATLASHYLQLQSYLHFHSPLPYDYGYLLYYNRDSDKVAMFKVDYDMGVGEEMELKLLQLEEDVENERCPPATWTAKKCKFCPYSQRCKDSKDAT